MSDQSAEYVHVNHGKAEAVAAGYRDIILAQVGKGPQGVVGQIDQRDLLLLIDAYEEAVRMILLWWDDPDNPPVGAATIVRQRLNDGDERA